MVMLPALLLAFLAALTVPFAVRHSPETFGGMLYGSLFHVPYTDVTLRIAWPVFLLVAALLWGLFRLAKG